MAAAWGCSSARSGSRGWSRSQGNQDPQEVGRQAARLAIDRIAEPERPPRTVTVPSTLVPRGTDEADALPLARET
ncbi:substrate-binding domain-containing protein [Streptomyces panaciradicis]|uniref:substrate-binding domain-containing protein n=1 Tax=Streptomyces panaciradicis TaxID=1470261 RepID=UPI00201D1F56|nr:substrate-binding domain-containing protein [Streptomyces panaciradicis]MCL6667294.1 substrate-binding domain-containing protein [Streptomyces panaciradicis]